MAKRRSALPAFFKKGLAALRSLKLTPVVPGLYTSQNEARAEPVWHSHRHTIRDTRFADTWRTSFHFNRLQDFTVHGENREWAQHEMRAFLEDHTVQFNRAALRFFRWPGQYRHVRSVTVHDLLRQWNSFEEDVGYSNVVATWRDPSPVIDPRYSLFARREMRRQGWLGPHGGGLGKTLQGVTEPLDHKTGQPSSNKAGLGAKSRAPTRTKRDPYRTLVGVVSSDATTVVYGYPQERDGIEYLQVVPLTCRGLPVPVTGKTPLKKCDFSRMREVLWWHGVVGIAEATYPHPQGWTFAELETPIPLHKLRMRHLTTAFRNGTTVPPSCRRAWETALGVEGLPWHLIYQRLYHPALTSRDRKNNLRILNRSLSTRSWTDKSACCRLCGGGRDRLSHLCECPVIQLVFSVFESPPSPAMIYLGLRKDLTPLTGSDAVLYTVLWKFTLMSYTRVDCENEEFDVGEVIRSTLRRTHVRMEAMSGQLKLELERLRSRGDQSTNGALTRYRKHVHPDFSFDECGRLIAAESAAEMLRAAGCVVAACADIPVKRILTDEEEQDLQYQYDTRPPRATAQLAALATALQGEAVAHDKARRSSVAHAAASRARSRHRSK